MDINLASIRHLEANGLTPKHWKHIPVSGVTTNGYTTTVKIRPMLWLRALTFPKSYVVDGSTIRIKFALVI